MTTTLIEGDVLEILRALRSKIVHLFHLNIELHRRGFPTPAAAKARPVPSPLV